MNIFNIKAIPKILICKGNTLMKTLYEEALKEERLKRNVTVKRNVYEWLVNLQKEPCPF